MPTVRETMGAYTAAWNATNPQMRRNLLEQAMTEDAVIAYPNVEGRGWEAISSAIERVQQLLPGVRFVSTSGIEEHHGWLRATWRIIESDGRVQSDGEDVAEVADDGRLSRVIGFHDPPPPLK